MTFYTNVLQPDGTYARVPGPPLPSYKKAVLLGQNLCPQAFYIEPSDPDYVPSREEQLLQVPLTTKQKLLDLIDDL